jgi:hypothetical protein
MEGFKEIYKILMYQFLVLWAIFEKIVEVRLELHVSYG